MIRRFDFRCDNNHTDEYWVDHTVTTTQCNHCDSRAERLISTPSLGLDPLSGDFYGATRKWHKNREQKLKQERKQNQG